MDADRKSEKKPRINADGADDADEWINGGECGGLTHHKKMAVQLETKKTNNEI
jgi:hypothetical protein